MIPSKLDLQMSSLQIAEMAGRSHDYILKSIRQMESSWEKVCGVKFNASFYEARLPNGGTRSLPMYMLTKTQCLYIATKFNDEARARLVLRWEELESQQPSLPQPDILHQLDGKIRYHSQELAKLQQARECLSDIVHVPTTIAPSKPAPKPWKEVFLTQYGQEIYDIIHNNINDWLAMGEMLIYNFNIEYRPDRVSSKVFLLAISVYCKNNGISFTKNKCVWRNHATRKAHIFSKEV